MATVSFKQLNKIFDDGTQAVSDFNLDIADGEFVVLVGSSGCGKSTLLRMLAGLETITSGEIYIDNQLVNQQTPQQRNIAMVFQNYALYPHFSVRENLAFPLKMLKLPKVEIEKRVTSVTKLLALDELLARKPKQLSGGQRQRVAMGRAMVREPSVFLMDEPLSNLDAKLRVQIRTEIAALQKQMRTTTLYVTHDQVEAMTLGDRVAVIHHGRLQQIAKPEQLYQQPANVFVAGFIGNPGMNVFETMLQRTENNGLAIAWGEQLITLPTELVDKNALQNHVGNLLYAGLRPEAFCDTDTADVQVNVEVTAIEALGHESLLYFHSVVKVLDTDRFAEDKATRQLMVARLHGATNIKIGEKINLGLALQQLYFFTGDGLALKQI